MRSKPAGDDLQSESVLVANIVLHRHRHNIQAYADRFCRHKRSSQCCWTAVQDIQSWRTKQCPISFQRNGMLLYRAPKSCVHMLQVGQCSNNVALLRPWSQCTYALLITAASLDMLMFKTGLQSLHLQQHGHGVEWQCAMSCCDLCYGSNAAPRSTTLLVWDTAAACNSRNFSVRDAIMRIVESAVHARSVHPA